MKRIVTIVLSLFFVASGFVFAQSVDMAEAEALLRKADENTSFEGVDFSANYAMVQDRPGQGKSLIEATMYRRDSMAAFTIVITGPENDKGKGYVQFDNGLWFYDPHDKQFTFTSAKNKFQNTNANNSDFSPQHFCRDYKIEKATRVKLGSFACVLFELKAVSKNVDYPSLKLWVTEDDGLLRKKEDYSLSGQLLRTTAIPSYQQVSNRFVPNSMLIVDNLRGKKLDGKMQYEKTQVTVTNVSFAKRSDLIYTKKYLELMGQQ
ncbi:MAG: outer membrane lipoprotein-sorting protein [Treponema sp.]|nr:outer membrane lipoprotein-sorting protein [Treponema sp.]